MIEECRRYNMPELTINHYDSANLYMLYSNTKNTLLLDKISSELNCTRQSSKYTSKEDAYLMYE